LKAAARAHTLRFLSIVPREFGVVEAGGVRGFAFLRCPAYNPQAGKMYNLALF